MARALVPLSVVADNICSGLKGGDPTGSKKFVVLRHLISAYKDFHLYVDHDFDVKTVILEPDHKIEMPCDFITETKVGLMRGNHMAVLTLDRNMPSIDKNQTETVDYIEEILNGVTSGGFFYPFYNCDGFPDLNGYGCNLNHRGGLYNINKKTGTIEIGSMIPEDTKLVIEYKSDGVSAEGLKLVPSEQVDVLSYDAKKRYHEEDENWNAANWNQEQYYKFYQKTKRLYNFNSALYIASVAYNHTSEI